MWDVGGKKRKKKPRIDLEMKFRWDNTQYALYILITQSWHEKALLIGFFFYHFNLFTEKLKDILDLNFETNVL
jgi:hypothetical protein